ncbi:MAG TPA: hypothetical protein VHW44_01070 [Pseudonocardiaceae bacterium]|jgi:hypothetical protein|nr:hypothetical protein [Pseudonocardiaceae bacterium]
MARTPYVAVDSNTEITDATVITLSLREPERFALVFDRHGPHIHRYLARRPGCQVRAQQLREPRPGDDRCARREGRVEHPGDGDRGQGEPAALIDALHPNRWARRA